MKKKKICSEAEIGWATAQLGHDTMELYRHIADLGVQFGWECVTIQSVVS